MISSFCKPCCVLRFFMQFRYDRTVINRCTGIYCAFELVADKGPQNMRRSRSSAVSCRRWCCVRLSVTSVKSRQLVRGKAEMNGCANLPLPSRCWMVTDGVSLIFPYAEFGFTGFHRIFSGLLPDSVRIRSASGMLPGQFPIMINFSQSWQRHNKHLEVRI